MNIGVSHIVELIVHKNHVTVIHNNITRTVHRKYTWIKNCSKMHFQYKCSVYLSEGEEVRHCDSMPQQHLRMRAKGGLRV